MQTLRASFFSLLILFLALSTTPSWAQTPAPATETPFQLPLADKTTAQAVFLPTADGQAYLVYATKTGQIVFYHLTPASPNPTPIPPPDPIPPATTVSVITITETDAAALPSCVQTHLDLTGGNYHAFTVAMVSETSPPANALQWIGRSAGKAYPYSFITSTTGDILWQGATPADAATFFPE